MVMNARDMIGHDHFGESGHDPHDHLLDMVVSYILSKCKSTVNIQCSAEDAEYQIVGEASKRPKGYSLVQWYCQVRWCL